jgi:hypothetical protein
MAPLPTVKIAACHASPIFLNAEKTTEKALKLVDEVSLLVAFVPSWTEEVTKSMTETQEQG